MGTSRAGYKTTEFWLSLLTTLMGFIMVSGVLDSVDSESWIVKVIGGIIAGLASLGYTASRAKVKRNGFSP